MTKKGTANLKAVEPVTPREKLTYGQIKDLAGSLATFVWDNERLGDLLLILMCEIGRFYRDGSHVEGITIQVRDAVFAKTSESDKAEERYVTALREKFQKGVA